MATLLMTGAISLVGFWLAETVLFLLSYRSSSRAEGAQTTRRIP